MNDGLLHLGLLDRPHTPPPGSDALLNYKEWWHFNLNCIEKGIDIIINLSLTGDIYSSGKGHAHAILLVYEEKYGWYPIVERLPSHAIDLSKKELSLRIGNAHLDASRDELHLDFSSEAHPELTFVAQFKQNCDPFMIWKNTEVDSGRINWFVLPRMQTFGFLKIRDRNYNFHGDPTYHDHNWGNWKWGENFGWDWGFVISNQGDWAIIYDRTTDRSGGGSLEHSLAVWRDGKLAKFFSRLQIYSVLFGLFKREILRFPEITRLMDFSKPAGVPERLEAEAQDGEDWISLVFTPDTALQISIPSQIGTRLVSLNEVLGFIDISGEIGGESFRIHQRSCFEFLRQ